jgi:hypothetical protein
MEDEIAWRCAKYTCSKIVVLYNNLARKTLEIKALNYHSTHSSVPNCEVEFEKGFQNQINFNELKTRKKSHFLNLENALEKVLKINIQFLVFSNFEI